VQNLISSVSKPMFMNRCRLEWVDYSTQSDRDSFLYWSMSWPTSLSTSHTGIYRLRHSYKWWRKWKSDPESGSGIGSPPKVDQLFRLVGAVITSSFNEIRWLCLYVCSRPNPANRQTDKTDRRTDRQIDQMNDRTNDRQIALIAQ